MESEHGNGYSNPHWKSDIESSISEQDYDGSFRIPVRALNIIWGNDPRFWQWIKLTDNYPRLMGFNEGAVLLQVNWIEVTGKLELTHRMLASTSTKYKIYYIVKFRADAFGWHSVPIKFKVRSNGVERQISDVLERYREKHDLWHEIPGGEFSVSEKNNVGSVEFGMYEVESDWWKGSMVLAGIKVLPC